jgi:hypothetical protein
LSGTPRKKGRTKRTAKRPPTALLDPTAAAKARALSAFTKLGTISHACEAAGVGRTTWYDWIEKDPEFQRAVADTSELVLDELEREAIKRAKGKGGSDTLLIFLLKSLRRSKYGDRQIITTISPEVQAALQQTIQLIASRETWSSEELLALMQPFWK